MIEGKPYEWAPHLHPVDAVVQHACSQAHEDLHWQRVPRLQMREPVPGKGAHAAP